jgi:hypothetical protein
MRVGLTIAKDGDVCQRSVGHQFYPVANIFGRDRVCESWMVGGEMVKNQCHHFIVIVSPHNNAAFASDLPDQ